MSSSGSRPDFTGVTETAGTRISRDAASMAMSRYEVVRHLAAGKRVLEIACGVGQGIGLVSRDAAFVIAGDVMQPLLRSAHDHYGTRAKLACFDAHALPFADAAFDVIHIHEATYYMADVDGVLRECRRALAPSGTLVISSINPEWADFNPSPHAVRYLTAMEFEQALLRLFSRAEIRFGFEVHRGGVVSSVMSMLKRLAVRWRLIPKTMKGKTLLKRLAFGELVAAPAELTPGFAPVAEPVRAPLEDARRFRILYAVAGV